jgi:hypothetical protein
VVIFPEGTSTNGETILPFRTSLLEPAARGSHEISVGWLHYELYRTATRPRKFVTGATTHFSRTCSICSAKNPSAPRCDSENSNRTTDDRKELAVAIACRRDGAEINCRCAASVTHES